MLKICTKWKLRWIVSPLCNNRPLYKNLKYISDVKWVSFMMMLSVSFAESHIGVNFKPSKCSSTNNWWWIKWSKANNGKVDKINLPDKNWCRLYSFNSVEEYWNALANTLKLWYYNAWCNNATCLSDRYVWWPWVDMSWVNRVNSF